MLFTPARRGPADVEPPNRTAALDELRAETTRDPDAPPVDLDEAALLLLAVHPALSQDWQEVLLLRAALWFEPEEIARITSLTPASVDTRLRGAYRRLRSTGLGAPALRSGLPERADRTLELLERLYWRSGELASMDPELSQRLGRGVVSRIETLTLQAGTLGAEAHALLAFLTLSATRMGAAESLHERGSRHLQAAEQGGASGRYLWLARIMAAYLGSTVPGSGAVDWRRIALMWEVIHEIDRPSAARWLCAPLGRFTPEPDAGNAFRVGSTR